MKFWFLIIIVISLNSLAQEEANFNYLSQDDQNLIGELKTTFNKKNWLLDDNELQFAKTHYTGLKNLNLFFKNKKPSKTSVIITFYLGVLEYYVFENFELASSHFIYVYNNKHFLKGNKKAEIKLYTSLGHLEKIQNRYSNSIYFYNKGLDFALETKNYLEQHRICREIGANYLEIEAFDLAENYLINASRLNKKANLTTEDKVWMKIHVGRLFRLKKEFNKAKQNYNEAFGLIKTKNEKRIFGYALHEYLFYWSDLKKQDSLKKYSKALIEYVKNTNNSNLSNKISKAILINPYRFLGDIALKNNNKEKAELNYYASYKIAKEVKITESTRLTAKWICKHAENQKIKNEAFNYLVNSHKNTNYNPTLTTLKQRSISKLLKNDLATEIDVLSNKYLSANILLSVIFAVTLLVIFYRYRTLKNCLKDINKQIYKNNYQLQNLEKTLHYKAKNINEMNKNALSFSKYLTSITPKFINLDNNNSTLIDVDKHIKLITYFISKSRKSINSNPVVHKQEVNIYKLLNETIHSVFKPNQTHINNTISKELSLFNYKNFYEKLFTSYLLELNDVIHQNQKKPRVKIDSATLKNQTKISFKIKNISQSKANLIYQRFKMVNVLNFNNQKINLSFHTLFNKSCFINLTFKNATI